MTLPPQRMREPKGPRRGGAPTTRTGTRRSRGGRLLAAIAGMAVVALVATADGTEAALAFSEKRQPNWKAQ